MIITVESDFLVELALRRAEAAHCERLIALAGQKLIELAIPACSLFEPRAACGCRNGHRELRDELAQLARSEGYANLFETSKAVTRALAEAGEVQGRALDMTIDRISGIATVIPLTAEILRHGFAVRRTYPLSCRDSIVFASIDKFMAGGGTGPKLFVNKSYKDLATAEIEAHLERHGCKVVASFSAACSIVEHVVDRAN